MLSYQKSSKMARDWREKYINAMTGKEIIHYLMHFDLDTEVVFVDKDGFVHSLTTDDRETYLGNGKYNKTPKDIKLQSAIIKYRMDKKTNRTILSCTDFKQGEYVKLVDGKYANKVGVVIGIPRCDGGSVYYMPSGNVCVLIGTGAEPIPASYLEKITKEEYNKLKENNGK